MEQAASAVQAKIHSAQDDTVDTAAQQRLRAWCADGAPPRSRRFTKPVRRRHWSRRTAAARRCVLEARLTASILDLPVCLTSIVSPRCRFTGDQCPLISNDGRQISSFLSVPGRSNVLMANFQASDRIQNKN